MPYNPAQLLMGSGLLQRIGDVIEWRKKGVNPMNTTEGARPYYGGGEVVNFPRPQEVWSGTGRAPDQRAVTRQLWESMLKRPLTDSEKYALESGDMKTMLSILGATRKY